MALGFTDAHLEEDLLKAVLVSEDRPGSPEYQIAVLEPQNVVPEHGVQPEEEHPVDHNLSHRYDSDVGLRRRFKRNDYLTPRVEVSTHTDDGVSGMIMRNIAVVLSRADQAVLNFRYHMIREQKKTTPAEKLLVSEISNIYHLLEACRTDRQRFSRNYIRDTGILKHWNYLRSDIFDEDSPNAINYLDITRILSEIERVIIPLPRLLKAAATDKCLHEDDLRTMEGRWMAIDDMVAAIDRWDVNLYDRITPAWPEIAVSLRKLAFRGPSATFVETPVTTEKDWTSTMMWATFLLSVVAGFPTFALGWQHSGTAKGTTSDADFWFLLQSCGMSLLGLLTMAIPMWTDDLLGNVHSWLTWSFVATACLCTVVAPPVYLFAPTYWSAFLMTVVGSIQAWVTVQMAFVARLAPKKARETDLKLDHQD